MKKTFWFKFAPILAGLISAASIFALLYFGVIVMFIGGIIQFVDSLKQTDIPTSGVAFGVARVFFAGFSTVLIGIALFFANAYVWVLVADKKSEIRREMFRGRIGSRSL
jgi:hypothetical protein